MAIEKIIKISLDTTDAKNEVDQIKTELEGLENKAIVVELDTTDAVTNVDELTSSLEEIQDVDVSATLDTMTSSAESYTSAAGEAADAQKDLTVASSAGTTAVAANAGAASAGAKATTAGAAAAAAKAKATRALTVTEQQWLRTSNANRIAALDELKNAKLNILQKIRLRLAVRRYTSSITRLTGAQVINTKATNSNTTATSNAAIADSKAAIAKGNLTTAARAQTTSMLSSIPIVGRYIGAIGSTALALIAAVAVFGRAFIKMREVNDAMTQYFDILKNYWAATTGTIQAIYTFFAEVVTKGIDQAKINFDANLEAISQGVTGLSDVQRKLRETEAAFILAESEVAIEIAEARSKANDDLEESAKDRLKAADDWEKAIAKDYKLHLEREELRLQIMKSEAELNDTLVEDEVEIARQQSKINQLKAQYKMDLIAVQRIQKRITNELKNNNDGGGGSDDIGSGFTYTGPDLSGDVRTLSGMPLATFETGLRMELELREYFHKKSVEIGKSTADQLEINSAIVRRNDEIVLSNKLNMWSGYAQAAGNLSSVIMGYYDDQLNKLRENGITEGAEYEKLMKRKQAAAIASIGFDAASAILATWAAYAYFGPAGPGLAIAQTAVITATAAAQIAAVRSAANGGTPSTGAGSGAAPNFNIIAANEYNPIPDGTDAGISDAAADTVPVTKVYVLSKDVTTAQEFDRAVANNSSL